ncbi:hypothetical protein [Prochlorothrix hollandica]|uniref:Uncharacterized protein n=1 Tax=Prochlorothrix hollandica PCC 9006 = CALU 1027 TaxID=317619 RepID=A0A0M2PYV6_PROHO|nr:hypothetical protein [Prochlorothrix hollandica]KKJ01325.1 hypothetical protein PROH_02930 [Prochlorothrix hollandica PCC 9006 = CALU 1027]
MNPALGQTDTTGTWKGESRGLLGAENEGSFNPYDLMHRFRMMRDVDGFYDNQSENLNNAAASFLQRQQQMLQTGSEAPPVLTETGLTLSVPDPEMNPGLGVGPRTVNPSVDSSVNPSVNPSTDSPLIIVP